MNVLNKIKSKTSKLSNSTQAKNNQQNSGKQQNQQKVEKIKEAVEEKKEEKHEERRLSDVSRDLRAIKATSNFISRESRRKKHNSNQEQFTYDSEIKDKGLSNLSKFQNSSVSSTSKELEFSYRKIIADQNIKLNDSDKSYHQICYDLTNILHIYEIIIDKAYQFGDIAVFEGTMYELKFRQFLEKQKNIIPQTASKACENFIMNCSHNSLYLLGFAKTLSIKAQKYFVRSKMITISDQINILDHVNSLQSISRLYCSQIVAIGEQQLIIGENSLIRAIQKKGTVQMSKINL